MRSSYLFPHYFPAQFSWTGCIFLPKATVSVRCPSPPTSPLQIPGLSPPPSPFWTGTGTALALAGFLTSAYNLEGREGGRVGGRKASLLNSTQLPSLRTVCFLPD